MGGIGRRGIGRVGGMGRIGIQRRGGVAMIEIGGMRGMGRIGIDWIRGMGRVMAGMGKMGSGTAGIGRIRIRGMAWGGDSDMPTQPSIVSQVCTTEKRTSGRTGENSLVR